MKPEQITVGPFTWTRRDTYMGDKCECWDLDNAVELIGMHWSCKNYGKASYEGSPFSGWKCGSGGPWPEQYNSREDAMTRVILYLIERMKERLTAAEKKVEKLRSIVQEYSTKTDQQ